MWMVHSCCMPACPISSIFELIYIYIYHLYPFIYIYILRIYHDFTLNNWWIFHSQRDPPDPFCRSPASTTVPSVRATQPSSFPRHGRQGANQIGRLCWLIRICGDFHKWGSQNGWFIRDNLINLIKMDEVDDYTMFNQLIMGLKDCSTMKSWENDELYEL